MILLKFIENIFKFLDKSKLFEITILIGEKPSKPFSLQSSLGLSTFAVLPPIKIASFSNLKECTKLLVISLVIHLLLFP